MKLKKTHTHYTTTTACLLSTANKHTFIKMHVCMCMLWRIGAPKTDLNILSARVAYRDFKSIVVQNQGCVSAGKFRGGHFVKLEI